jgi:AcrR family transcriptional regulator
MMSLNYRPVLDRLVYNSQSLARPQLHSENAILDAARTLVLDGGARAATINAIVEASGAPKGSIYHRFPSLNDLLARLWIRAVRRSQAEFIEALENPHATSAAVTAALSLYDFAKREPADARLLVSLRREDLVESVTPHLQSELTTLNRPIEAALSQLAGRLYGGATTTTIERTVTAVVDLPMGAIRRHLVAGTRFPPTLRGQLEAAVRGALSSGEER